VGKGFAALQLVKAVNCREGGGDSCDVCQNCRLVDKGQFPDLLVPESKGGKILKGSSATEKTGMSLSELLPRLHYRPLMGKHKFMILDPADGLTEEAANMLLKTLEEPPPQTTFLLITSRERSVLPTVMSRCQQIRFNPLSEEIVQQLLMGRGVDAGAARIAARASQGSMGAAVDAMASGYLKRRMQCADLLLGWANPELATRIEAGMSFLDIWMREASGDDSKTVEERRAVETLAQVASLLCRDMLWSLAGEKEGLVVAERESAVRSLARRVGYEGAVQLSGLVGQVRNAYSHNENNKHILHWFGSEWSRLVSVWEADKGKYSYAG